MYSMGDMHWGQWKMLRGLGDWERLREFFLRTYEGIPRGPRGSKNIFTQPGLPPAYHTSTRAPLIPLHLRSKTWKSKWRLFSPINRGFHFKPALPGWPLDFGHLVHSAAPARNLSGHLAEENFFKGFTIFKPRKTAPQRPLWWTDHTCHCWSEPTSRRRGAEAALEPLHCCKKSKKFWICQRMVNG